jgi:hypothetical protein
MENNQEDNYLLIECGNHQWAPWSVVCTHLLTGTSKNWVSIESEHPEVDFDWLCPDCFKEFNREYDEQIDHKITYLRPVCIHCVKKLRRIHDKNWDGE